MFALLLVATLLLPCMMLAIGLLWRRHPPKDINSLYGYRTPRSTHSREAWAFAHQYCSRVWLVCGGALLAVTLAVMLLCARAEWAALWQRATLWLVGAQVIVMLLSIIPVERALKARFGAQGRARGKGGSSS